MNNNIKYRIIQNSVFYTYYTKVSFGIPPCCHTYTSTLVARSRLRCCCTVNEDLWLSKQTSSWLLFSCLVTTFADATVASVVPEAPASHELIHVYVLRRRGRLAAPHQRREAIKKRPSLPRGFSFP